MKLTAKQLALFLGCKIEYFDYFKNGYEIGILNGIGTDYFFVKDDNNGQDIDKCRPILRPISDITDEELKEVFLMEHSFEGTTISSVKFSHREELFGRYAVRYNCEYVIDKTGKENCMMGTVSFKNLTANQFEYLLYKHFDVFGWIKSGLAIQDEELHNLPEPKAPESKNFFPPINELK